MKLLPQRAKSLLDKEVNEALSTVLTALVEIVYNIAYMQTYVNLSDRQLVNSTSTYDIKIKYVFV